MVRHALRPVVLKATQLSFQPEFCRVTDQLMTLLQSDLPACGIHQVSSERTPVAYLREWGVMSPSVFLICCASYCPLPQCSDTLPTV